MGSLGVSCISNYSVNILLLNVRLFKQFVVILVMINVAVLGAGVIGVSCALKIQEKYKDSQVVIISNEFTPNTTGDGSGGLWYPYLCGNTPGDVLKKWAHESYKFLHELWLEGGHGVSVVPIYVFRRDGDDPTPVWAKSVFGYRDFDRAQLEYFSRLYSSNYAAGHTLLTFIIPPEKLMTYLHKRFEGANGKTIRAKLTSLKDQILEGFDIIVNCTGVGAKYLVPDDEVFAIRGQITKVVAPWISECVIDYDGGNYIIPNSEACVLGGTHQENDYNTKVDDNDKQFIIEGCKIMVPALKDAKQLNDWAGLRPGRTEIRLKPEMGDGKLFIHNYGHGGSGLTLFWGCASDVVDLIKIHFNEIKWKKSKL